MIALEFDVFRVKEEILNSISSMVSFLKGFSLSLKVNGITFKKENTIYRLICCNPGISLDLKNVRSDKMFRICMQVSNANIANEYFQIKVLQTFK